jgi:hypothetical protein
MDQDGPVRTKLMLDSIEPHHRSPLPLRDRLTCLAAVDPLACRINRPGTTLRLLPITLKSATAPVLRFVDLVVSMQLCEGIAAGRTQRNNLVAGFKPQRIVDFDGCHLRV